MVFDRGPGEELYGAYAAGVLDPALKLLLETQGCLRENLYKRLSQADMVAGALLERERPAPMSFGAIDRALEAIDVLERDGDTQIAEAVQEAGQALDELIRLPEPLRDIALEAAGQEGWKFAGPGLRIMRLPMESSAEAELLRIEPGFGAPMHSHKGSEYTLVVTGAFTDEIGNYKPGDISIAGPGVTHKPVADQGEVCFARAVREGDLEFKGLLGMLQKVVGRAN